MAKISLTIQHNNVYIKPPIVDELKIEWERTGSPGKLTFTTLGLTGKEFTEGDTVRFSYDGKLMFVGFVFTKKRNKKEQIEVTCYDQVRYLKNKYTYAFEKKTATDITKALCKDYGLATGTLNNTSYKIPSVIEENKSALDIILGTLEETLLNTGKMFVLYDDCGKLTLKNSENMISETLVFKDSAEDFEYSSSIDDETYNSIILYYKPKSSGTADSASTADASRIIQIAATQLGTSESPSGSNRQKYGSAYGLNGQPWCCIFVWWVFKEAGLSNLFYGGSKTAYCPTAMSWFKSKGRWYTSNPQPGDCVFFNWSGGNSAQHIGIVESVKSNGSVVCIEGNCSNRVKRMVRSSGIIGYGRPNYSTGDDSSSTSTTTGSEKIQVFTAQSKSKINQWGTLRYFEEIDKPSIGKTKAKQLLNLYCRKTRELKVTGVIGDATVRGGTLIPVKLNIGDTTLNNYMLVEKVTHTFKNNSHTMDLTLEGAWDD